MVVDGMMSLVKHQQADISAQRDVSMAKSIKEYLRSRYHDTMCSKDSFPKSSVSPLIRFVGARDYTYRDWYIIRDDMFLLFAQCYSWCKEPGKLQKLNWP